MKGGTADKATEFDFSPLNELVGVNFQLSSSDFNKFEISLTDTAIKNKKYSKTSIVKWLSYTVNCPPSNGPQEGQAQSIPNLFFDDAVEWHLKLLTHSHSGFCSNLSSRTLGKLRCSQSL